MPRLSKIVSIAAHALVIGLAAVWSGIAPGILPSPREMLAFHDVSMIKAVDMPVPPAPARPIDSAARAVSRDAAPLQPPTSITPDTGNTASGVRSTAPDVGVVNGIPGGVVGVIDAVPPPAPPPLREPAKPMRLHEGMKEPQKIVDVKPVYPKLAQLARREGVVILEAVIDVTGRVQAVRVLKGIPMLDDAAVEAVRQWRFTPALLNREPVPVVMTVTVKFALQ